MLLKIEHQKEPPIVWSVATHWGLGGGGRFWVFEPQPERNTPLKTSTRRALMSFLLMVPFPPACGKIGKPNFCWASLETRQKGATKKRDAHLKHRMRRIPGAGEQTARRAHDQSGLASNLAGVCHLLINPGCGGLWLAMSTWLFGLIPKYRS